MKSTDHTESLIFVLKRAAQVTFFHMLDLWQDG